IKDANITFTPGSTTVSSSTFIRGNNISARGSINDAGFDYGCTVKDVTITGNNKSITKSSGTNFKVDSSFIKDYIYNGDQSKYTLTAKANFERTERVYGVNCTIGDNGVVKLGDKVINTSYISSNAWYQGDKLRLTIVPNQGYHVASITAGGKTYKQGEDISLANNMVINVQFARDDNSVIVMHDYVGTYAHEDLETNLKHGKLMDTYSQDYNDYERTTPYSREEFGKRYISTATKEELLLGVYQQYVENNGLADKFTNEIPEWYLRSLNYVEPNEPVGSNKNFDYKAKLTLNDYKRLITYFKNGGVPQDVIDDGTKIIKQKLALRLKSNRNDLLLQWFGYEKGGTFHNDTIYYNGTKIETYYYNDLIDKFCDALFSDWFAGANRMQRDNIYYNLDLPYIVSENEYVRLDLSNEDERNIFAMTITNTNETKIPLFDLVIDSTDETAGYYTVDDIDEQKPIADYIDYRYRQYLKEVEEKNVAAANAAIAAGNFSIKNLTTGDTVNLLAELEDGYTCVWLYNDSANEIDESDQPIYTIHVGDSFSFEVQNKAALVKYYFVPVNDRLPDTFIHGRVVRSKQTLRTPSSERLNINDSSTYQAVQGMDITIGSIDPYAKGEIDGKTYYPTTQTDANGYFDVLVPHGMEGLMTNLILANGEKTYVKHAVILDKSNSKDQTIIFALPYQDDNIWVRSFKFE
ncbi:MAG: hypothetical protein IJ736_00095, partial [Firmicutes bacterium]|nr:hypothetical protein [Bacillota bacterium]